LETPQQEEIELERRIVLISTWHRSQPTLAKLTCFLLVAIAPAIALSQDDPNLAPLVAILDQLEDDAVRLDILKGMRAGLKGRKSVAMPKGWSPIYKKLSASKSEDVKTIARELALIFGDPLALKQLGNVVHDASQSSESRKSALAALLEKHPADLPESLRKLLDDKTLRGDAIRGLAAYAHKDTPNWLIGVYKDLSANERQDVVNTLASRATYATRLLDAIQAKEIDRRDGSAFIARQLASLGNKDVNKQLEAIWGKVRESSAEKEALIATWKKKMNNNYFKKADVRHGRAIFAKTCMKCHKLYGEGGKIGPDITGSNRANLDYILHNVLDPSAAISKDYQMSTVITINGRVVTGIVQEKNASRVVVQTDNEKLTIAAEDVDEITLSAVSMMPEGQLDKMTREEIRDLVVYLRTKNQVPLPEGFKLEQ
jgi:putative heme-binding domain-containing protein